MKISNIYFYTRNTVLFILLMTKYRSLRYIATSLRMFRSETLLQPNISSAGSGGRCRRLPVAPGCPDKKQQFNNILQTLQSSWFNSELIVAMGSSSFWCHQPHHLLLECVQHHLILCRYEEYTWSRSCQIQHLPECWLLASQGERLFEDRRRRRIH